MSYDGSGEVSAIYRPEGSVEALLIRSTSARFIAPGSLTDGRFGLFRWDMPPSASGASPHFHRTFSESFFILSGTVDLFDGARWISGGAGDFLYVPEGGIHGFRNGTDGAASMLILFAPGAPRERYFRELAEIFTAGRSLTREDWAAMLARHDQYAVPG